MTELEQIECNRHYIVNPFIEKVKKIINSPIELLANPDKERYIHSCEFVFDIKKETIYKRLFSDKLWQSIEIEKEICFRQLKIAEIEYLNIEKLKMPIKEYRQYFLEQINNVKI